VTRERVIVLGALSAIAEATARIYAGRGAELLLAARNQARLAVLRDDLLARGARRCEVRSLDLAKVDDTAASLAGFVEALGGTVDAVFLFYGILGDQRADERDLAAARQRIRVNFESAAEWCLAAANQLERQKGGVLVAASSVAGDRGRQSNYIYGSAKAGLSVLVQGIAHRLAPSGARAVLVKLGFVDTPMTAHVEQKGALWATPADVAERLVKLADKPSRPVVYVPWFWRGIMLIIRNVPAAIFHKTRL
jgi:decaprenylphospho-beta-D-erythro-pentofuranosid-2-ulose 2-reductase